MADDKAEPFSDEVIANLLNMVRAAEIFSKAMGYATVTEGFEVMLKSMQAMQKASQGRPIESFFVPPGGRKM